jgi:hypothetical protein
LGRTQWRIPEEERKALKGLLDVALTRSDADSIVPRPLSSETMFMLMLIRLKEGQPLR